MKKVLLAALMTFSTLSVMADLNGDAYYRVQSAVTKRYAYLLDDKGSVDVATSSADVNALHLYSGFLKASSDPASVFLFQKAGGSAEYNVTGQGASLYNLFGQYMKIVGGKEYEGKKTYLLYAQKSGLTKYLGDLRMEDDNEKGLPSIQATGDRRLWYVDNVNPDGSNYFGIAPTLTANGKYYQPMFAGFSFAPYSEGVKTFVISAIDPSMGVVVLSEAAGNIAAGTPVIMECANPLAADNRLTIGPDGTATTISSNKLMGVYFDNSSQLHYNRTPYDKTSMRSLVVKDGKLKFVVGDYEFCPRNEAILKLTDTESQSIEEYEVMTEADYNAYQEMISGMVPDGYYRLQNAATKRYAYLLDNRGSSSDISSIQLYSDILKATSDPATVMYVSHVDGGKQTDRNMAVQGTNTSRIFGNLSLSPADVKEGVQAYYVATSSGNIGDTATSGDKGTPAVGVSGDASQWWFNPIDNEANHFGVAPTITAGGKYYHPLVVSFPFVPCSDGVKVYVISKIDPKVKAMVLKEVDGEIKAGAPVIIECKSPLASDNRLTPLATSSAVISGNLLNGLYFDSNYDGHVNRLPYDQNSMRSLAEVDGKLKFVKGDYEVVPRNQAYIVLSGPEQQSVAEYDILTPEEYADVSGVTAIGEDEVVDVYHVDGTLVRSGVRRSEVDDMPHGIYLVRQGDRTEKVLH